MHPTHLPLRLATGAFILNSGLSKLGADEDTATFLHGAAAGTYPAVFKDMEPKTFATLLAYGEIGVGVALLVPMVPATVAGAALTGFGASLMGTYFTNPAMTQADGIRPSPEGTGLAKDVWLVGAGLTLLTQGIGWAAKKKAQATGKKIREVTPFTS
ncbi:DoxX family membrane protein [Ornithinimicrobium cryptoxanthini]|uniref:DoxX family membrane protein n=1 Tax=Ornithinimicrobium cryptoxanthini TaxID=2934161 RepID=UPI002117EF1C|nr:DoxX family membrane protein [Ornithinimicrobium cryptoxanthini]